jgi:hypothetical protein
VDKIIPSIGSDSPTARGPISLLILSCLGIQSLLTIVLLPIGFKATWPFVNYTLYTQAHRDGDPIPNQVILGEREDGSKVVITPNDLGWNKWFYQLFAKAILNHDRNVVSSFLRQGPRTRDMQWVSLRVVDRGAVFRWSGAVQVPEKELGIMRLKPAPEEAK